MVIKMKFYQLLAFLKKRFEEIGFDDIQELERFSLALRVKHPHVASLSSGVVIDPEYKEYGFEDE